MLYTYSKNTEVIVMESIDVCTYCFTVLTPFYDCLDSLALFFIWNGSDEKN